MLGAALAIAMVAAAAPASTVEPPATHPLTVISLTFDDGYLSQFPAALAMEQSGLVGTFYINTGALEWPGYLDMDQVRHLSRKGHEIGGHTADHVRLTSLDDRRARHLICSDRQDLLDAGFDVRTFAYPFGAYDDAVADAVMDCGYDGARTASGLFVSQNECGDCPITENWPEVDHRFNIRTPATVRSTDSVLDVQQRVRTAERVGGWLPIVFHRICDECARESMTLEDFRAFVRWLETRPSTTIVAPVAQALDIADARSQSDATTLRDVSPNRLDAAALPQRTGIRDGGEAVSTAGRSAVVAALVGAGLASLFLYRVVGKRRR